MKKLVLFSLICLLAGSAQAQIVKDMKYPRGHFGIRTAFTSNSQSYAAEHPYSNFKHDACMFVSGGFAADFRIAPIPIYLETGLYYINRGYKGINFAHGGWWYHLDEEDLEEVVSDHSIMMPLLVSYHLYLTDNMALQPFVGPYVGYGFDMERLDYGIRAGLGWNFGRLYLNVGYDFGIEHEHYTNNTFFCTIGVNFAGSY